jgi:hypothetical protein
VPFQGTLLYILYKYHNSIILTFNIATSSRDQSPQRREESGLDFKYRTLLCFMTRRPQKPAVAQRATSSPSSIRPPYCYTSEHTSPHHQNTPNPHTDHSRLPEHTPNRSTHLSSHHTQHIPHNGPSKGVPRDAARVRQGRPPVHHQVQQAYVFTTFLLAKRKRKKRRAGCLH